MIIRQNYLRVKKHLVYLESVLQISEVSVERYWNYLRHLLLWADDHLLNQADRITPSFPHYLAALPGLNGQGTLSSETQKKIIELSRRFFHWAKGNYAREFKHLPDLWIDSLRPMRSVGTVKEHIFVTMDEAIQLATTPVEPGNIAMQRDRAAAAMLFLSGMRASAFTTLPIKAVDIQDCSVRQWPELGVRTKNSKMATTFLLPIPELIEVAEEWDEFVRAHPPTSGRWYAPVEHTWGEQTISDQMAGENRNIALGRRLKVLFQTAGLPFKSAHKFRHGHAVYGLLHAQTVADYKAVSMNLMHGDIKITDSIYAPMMANDVKERIGNLTYQAVCHPADELVQYIGGLSNGDLSRVMMIVAQRLAA